jgi:hypothetical protein
MLLASALSVYRLRPIFNSPSHRSCWAFLTPCVWIRGTPFSDGHAGSQASLSDVGQVPAGFQGKGFVITFLDKSAAK